MIPYCKANGIGLIPWWSLHQGDLASLRDRRERLPLAQSTMLEIPLSDTDKAIIKRVEELAKKERWKMSEVALSWVQSKVTSPIVGIGSVRLRSYFHTLAQRSLRLNVSERRFFV